MRICYLVTLCLLTMPLAAFAMPVPWHESTDFYASVATGKSIFQLDHADYKGLHVPTHPVVNYTLLSKTRDGGKEGYRWDYSWLTAAAKSLRGDFYLQSSAPWGRGHGGNKPGIVKEPGTLVLFGVGLIGLGLARRRISR